MENDLNDDDFELFLKQKVDQHKLYPSDNAWKYIVFYFSTKCFF
jgi:hypothetical protein